MGLFSKLFKGEDDEAPEGAERAAEPAPAAAPAPPPAETAQRSAAPRKPEQPAERQPAAPPAAPAQAAGLPSPPRAAAPVERKSSASQGLPPLVRKETGTTLKGMPQVNAAPAPAPGGLPPIAPAAAKPAHAPAATLPKQPAAAAPPRKSQPLPQRKPRTPRTTPEPVAPRPAGARPQPAADKPPPAPAAAAPPAASSLEAAVEAAVDELLASQPPTSNGAGMSDGDRRAVTETFASIARVHAEQLREFMFQLSLGRTPRQWPAVCRGVVQPLMHAARQIELPELLGALESFDAALERAGNGESAYVAPAAVEALQAGYAQLTLRMPEAFSAAVLGDGKRRLVLLEALLLQVPALRRRSVVKLYAAGLTSLEQLARVAPDEICLVAGVERPLAEAVVQCLARYERDRSQVDPTSLRGHLHVRLRALLARLAELQSEFERAEQEEAIDRKRTARRERDRASLELDQLFAELGELELIEQLKRCPMRGKIRRVESYLDQAAAPT